jgi:4-alpha-glucanotransferase
MRDLAARAAELGIQTEHIDGRGVRYRVSEAVVETLVAALENDGGEASDRRGVFVWRIGRTRELDLGPVLGASNECAWRLHSADGEVARGVLRDGRLILASTPSPGIYRLLIVSPEGGAEDFATTLVVAPETAFQGQGRDRLWVLAVQLYGLRSRRNWGHGDFTDLRELLRLCAEIGAAGVGLNPLHALFDDRAHQASPYAPNSRHFLNILYIDPEAVPEFPGREASGLWAEIARLQGCEQVDYDGVSAVKSAALRLAFRRFCQEANPARHADFNAFRREQWPRLDRFAAFEVLRRRFNAVWWDWPAPWRQPSEAVLEALRAEAGEELAYIEFVQWIADRQLAACKDEARRLGLPIGLYTDLAVGVEPGGADAWSGQDSVLRQVEVGAPPDALNLSGQAWGLAAFNPRGLEAQGFDPFERLLSDTMRHAGAMRLDHVLGLNRLYLIPFGSSPRDGAYVRYPLQTLLAIVAAESAKRECIVIGEDLGTVPDDLRAALSDWGIWSYMVMMFERDEDGDFQPPQEYKRNALATFSTHDLPTFSGWHTAHDLSVKRGLGIDPGETDAERDRARWLAGEALARCGLVRDRAWDYVDIARFLARTPSRVVAISIEDVLGIRDQPNIPGTMDEHPNWRRRLPLEVEALWQHADLRALADALAEEGRSFRAG